MRGAANFDKFRESTKMRLIGAKLSGVGSGFGNDRRGLSPDELCTPGSESFVASKRQFIGSPIGRAVATFHRLDREPIADGSPLNDDRLREWRKIGAEANVEASFLGIFRESLGGFVLEVARHERASRVPSANA